MRLKKLIKRFIFEEPNRARITLGTNVRLNPQANCLQLKADDAGAYPTASDLFAKTWVTFPASVKQWLGFECIAIHGFDDLGDQVTSIGFRLNDGTQDYWWNGSAWVANSANWNTEAEVAGNISTFPASTRKLQVVLNLVTTDPEHTPLVEMVKVLYASDVEFQDDLINRSLIPAIRSQFRAIADFPITLIADTASINLSTSFPLETPYNVVGIDSVYNHTDDPNHMDDLLLSYDSPSKTITLTETLDEGKQVWIRFYYEPEVAIRTSQDYSEINKVPIVILRDISLVNTQRLAQDDAVFNRDTGAGVKVLAPLQGSFDITMILITDKSRDQQFLADEAKRFFENNPFIRSKGMDEDYRLWLIDEYQDQSIPTQDEVHTGRLRFRIANALFFERPAVDVYAVQRLHLTGDMNALVTE